MAGVVAITGESIYKIKSANYKLDIDSLIELAKVSTIYDEYIMWHTTDPDTFGPYRITWGYDPLSVLSITARGGYNGVEGSLSLSGGNYTHTHIQVYPGDVEIIGFDKSGNIVKQSVEDKHITFNIEDQSVRSEYLSNFRKLFMHADGTELTDDDFTVLGEAYASPIYDKVDDTLKIGLGSYEKDGNGNITSFTFGSGQGQSIATRDDTIKDGNLIEWSAGSNKLTDAGVSAEQLTEKINHALALNLENGTGNYSLTQTTAIDIDDSYLGYDTTKSVTENTSTDAEIKYLPKSNSLEDRNKISDRDNVALGPSSSVLGDGNFSGPNSKRSLLAGKLNEVYPSNGLTVGLRNVVGYTNGGSHNSIVGGQGNTVDARSSLVVGLENIKTTEGGQGILGGQSNIDASINSIVAGKVNNIQVLGAKIPEGDKDGIGLIDSSIIIGQSNNITYNDDIDENNPPRLVGILISGHNNNVYGRACSAIGSSNIIKLNNNSYGNSFVGGLANTTTFGNNFLFGKGLIGASGENTIFGTYNTQWISNDTAGDGVDITGDYIGKAMFQIGCGTGDNVWDSSNKVVEVNRRNAFEVWKPEYDGDTITDENEKFGKVKVYRRPTEDNDVIRLQDIVYTSVEEIKSIIWE